MAPNDSGGLRPVEGAVVAVAGTAALFATFWDDAWHTDLGRDSAWIAPHVLLYGAMAIVGVIVAAWGVRAVAAARSVLAVLRNRPLMVAGAGGAATLAAAPVDAWWHASFGRDAVLWSPPHMLVIFASAALVTGVLAALPQGAPRGVTAPLCGLVLGDLAVVVMEYDTDVPQFRGVFYLPALLAAGLLSCWLVRRLVPGRLPVTEAVVAYGAARLLITVLLAAVGRDTTPVLPIAVLGLALADVHWPRAGLRYLAAVAGVGAIAWAASAAGLATEPASGVAVVAIPVIAAFVFALGSPRHLVHRVLTRTAIVVLAAAPVLGSPRPALAHDAGEGRAVRPVHLAVSPGSNGTLTLIATVPGSGCDALQPRDVSARRGGVTVTSPLIRAGVCRYTGHLRVPSGHRWFVYVDLQDTRGRLQAWVAVQADRRERIDAARELYRPNGNGSPGAAQIGVGVALYGLGVGLLALACRLAARTTAERQLWSAAA